MKTTSAPAALTVRKAAKRRMPAFVIRESHFSKRVETKWRYPQGRHSAVRQRHKGRPAIPRPGYGSPREAYGLHPSGLEPVLIHAVSQLDAVDAQKQGVIIGSTVGAKKRLQLIQKALAKKMTILSLKNPQQELENIAASLQERKKKQAERAKSKEQKQEERKKKAEDKKAQEKKAKKDLPEEKSAEDLKKEQDEFKKEQRELAEKTLIKRQ
ncbi:hypothetical protein HYX14_05040 [Candidatus Woesearchaeota archaeon]|nr:hypothetical protein [Candidatus Woesearchaeota archaeon]